MSVPPPGNPPRVGWLAWTGVALGGFLGTELRYVLGLLYPEVPGAFPWTTLTINVAGSLLLGWLTASWAGSSRMPRWVRAGAGPGLLGSFTTFSAVTLVIETQPGLLLPYLGASLLLGLAAAAAGMALGARGNA